MITEKSLSVLMQIQPTIVHFSKMLASVLQLDVEIVDDKLTRIAGTGLFNQHLGHRLTNNSQLLRYVLETKKEKIVTHSCFDPLCLNCEDKDNCKEKAFIGTPIIFQDRCIGVISLVAVTSEQQERIRDNIHDFSDYVQHISNIFVAKLLDEQEGRSGAQKVLLSLIEFMDQGVLILDDSNHLKFANPHALKILHIPYEKISGKIVTIRPLTYFKSLNSGHLQHIVSYDGESNIIIGQLHVVNGCQMFLMAFHQSHAAIDMSEARAGENGLFIEHLVGKSEPVRQLKHLISRVAPSPSSILITGESGTGKEVVARAIHKLSNRSEKPFIAINCAAIPEQLLESELFGYVKGAFTGASANGKQGLIQAADQGTLFLDEIGDMPLLVQAKLLRAIESREVQPIGSSRTIPVDIRIVSATNQNLEQFVSEGKFREDLYYRLNVIPIALPPLRERYGDVELLVHHFLNVHTKRLGLVYPGISDEVMAVINAWPWPGNLRELSNLMEYLVNVVPPGEVIDISLLPPNFAKHAGQAINAPVLPGQIGGEAYQSDITIPVKTIPVKSVPIHANPPLPADDQSLHGETMLEEMEKQMIREALQRYDNKRQAAEELGIGIATLYRKIKKYELSAD